ncbi:MAG: hypothetical protein WBB31_14190 [Saprospiraceae bacterium]
MKLFLISLLTFLGICNSIHGQSDATKIMVKEGMMESYNQAFDSLHPFIKRIIIGWDSLHREFERSEYTKINYVYVTSLHTDTLNLDSIHSPDLSKIRIIDINDVPYDDKADPEQEEWNSIRQDFWFYWTDILQDTLILKMGGFMEYWNVEFKMFDQNIAAFYNDAAKYDTIFKLNLQDEYSSSLTVPVTLDKVYMNQSTFEPSDELIGFASCTVAPYYLRNYEDEKHPFHIRRGFDLYFRVIATEASN